MILAIHIEFCRGFSYTTRFRRKNNGNGGRLYAGLPKKQEGTEEFPALPVSEETLVIVERQNVLANNDCRVYSYCHHYFVDLFWAGGILAGNSLSSLVYCISGRSCTFLLQLELLENLAENSVSEGELPPLFFAAVYLYPVVWMDSGNHLSVLSCIRSFIFLLSDLGRRRLGDRLRQKIFLSNLILLSPLCYNKHGEIWGKEKLPLEQLKRQFKMCLCWSKLLAGNRKPKNLHHPKNDCLNNGMRNSKE